MESHKIDVPVTTNQLIIFVHTLQQSSMMFWKILQNPGVQNSHPKTGKTARLPRNADRPRARGTAHRDAQRSQAWLI